MKFVFGTLLVLFLTYQALKAGSVWDSHEFPVKGAVVGIIGAEPVKGHLMRNWDGGVDVVTKDGKKITVSKHSLGAIGYPKDKGDRVKWRFWLPSLLIMLSYIVFLGLSLKKDYRIFATNS
jgi:hypothetical protein